MRKTISVLCGMVIILMGLALPSVASAAPVAASQGFAPIGATQTLTSPAGTLSLTVTKTTGAVAPVGASVPGTNGLVVGPNNTVVTPAQLTAIRHHHKVVILTSATLQQITVSGAECAQGGCWVWHQNVGPVQYWVYGNTIWHGWVGGNYWPNDDLYNCSNNGGFGWTVTVGYCLWQGNNPTSTSMLDIAVGFHVNFLFYGFPVSYFHWIYIGMGSLGWSVQYG